MSDLTQCNYCVLQEIKRRNKGKKVTVKRKIFTTNGHPDPWIIVYVDGVDSGTMLKELGTQCEC